MSIVLNSAAKQILGSSKTLKTYKSLGSIFSYYKKSNKNLKQLDFVLEFLPNAYDESYVNARIRQIHDGTTHEKLEKLFNVSTIYSFCKNPDLLKIKASIFSVTASENDFKITSNPTETALMKLKYRKGKDGNKFLSISYRTEVDTFEFDRELILEQLKPFFDETYDDDN